MEQVIPRFAHQTEAVETALREGSHAIFAETGTGKTVIGLDLITALPGPALVICPLSIIEPAWMADAKRFAPDLTVANLWASTPARRKKALLQRADLYLINFEGFRVLWAKHRQWLAEQRFRVLIVDESSKMKSWKTATTKAILEFGLPHPARGWHGVNHRFVMSGTPAPNIEYEYWAQMRLVDPTLLGDNPFVFQWHWFYPAVKDPANQRVVWQWSISDKNRKALMEKIATRASFFRKIDCLDLPPQIDQIRHVTMARDQRKAYEDMLGTFIAALGNTDFEADTAMASNKLSQLMKLRQITAGMLITLDGVAKWMWGVKLKALEDVLDELGDEQVIIWTQFHAEVDAILTTLNKRQAEQVKMGGGAYYIAKLDGRTPVHERTEIIAGFQDGIVRYLIAHPACAGHGLTFTNCAYNIYASLSYSLETYWQSRDRTHRIGQDRSVTYVHLICPETIDEALLKVLRRKGDVARAAAEMVVEYRKGARP